MKILKAGSVPSSKAPAQNFSGTVRRDAIVACEAPSRMASGIVTFEPGARTAWHTHPAGQLLIITAGCGWVQCEGGSRQTVSPGDSVWFPAHIRHWHGATATTAMTHIAIAESIDGSPVSWLDHVTDDEYMAG